MATLVLSAVGTFVAGPIGAIFGGKIGSSIDAKIFGVDENEGPRLTELKVTTSSYGTPVPRHFGRMRAAGTIVWATDLRESSERTGGGKNAPATVTYSYSASFAVALASRPIARLGRIWSDGTLLRGAAGDLKVGGTLRLHTGRGDQAPDPLIASAEGSQCPAFRGLAYCVFEDLQLAEFGNRIPALTFEVIADNGDVSLTELVRPAAPDAEIERPLGALEGYSDEGGDIARHLASLDRVYPLSGNADGDALRIVAADAATEAPFELPPAIVDRSGESFGEAGGRAERRKADEARVPAGLRYYDVARDFQAGLQRASGRAGPGRNSVIEFPGALQAASAKELADKAATRAALAQERLAYRIADIDERIRPGAAVSVPGRAGTWRVEAWEWREGGVELELLRLPQRLIPAMPAEAGRSLPQDDAVATATRIEAFELPWLGTGSGDTRQAWLAATSESAGWRGAALYAETGAGLEPVGSTGTRRSVVGTTLGILPARATPLLDRHSHIEVQLASADFVLESRSLKDLAQGANRALIGEEIVQFALAESLGDARWRLSGLLRGRGGTEHLAQAELGAGARFVLLDDALSALDMAALGSSDTLAAIGLADSDPALATIGGSGLSLRPLTPVHPRVRALANGGLELSWTRRARGTWTWNSTVEVPLAEQSESYEVGIGDPDAPLASFVTSEPGLSLAPSALAGRAGEPLWVRQIGTHARSLPLLLTTLS